MNPADLSNLGIDRTSSARLRRRRRRWAWAIAAVSLIAAAAAASAKYSAPIAVETAPVTTAYPSQAMTTLTATGYVVAQRKAAVASKATGRLEWLGVGEGSHVKRGEVIARLESADVAANREQAAAALEVAQANLVQGMVVRARSEKRTVRESDMDM